LESIADKTETARQKALTTLNSVISGIDDGTLQGMSKRDLAAHLESELYRRYPEPADRDILDAAMREIDAMWEREPEILGLQRQEELKRALQAKGNVDKNEVARTKEGVKAMSGMVRERIENRLKPQVSTKDFDAFMSAKENYGDMASAAQNSAKAQATEEAKNISLFDILSGRQLVRNRGPATAAKIADALGNKTADDSTLQLLIQLGLIKAGPNVVQ
jgi:hypothetical protein